MEKLKVAIIGQGRSGRNIHGTYFLGEANTNFEVVAVVDAIEYRREKAIREFGCKAFVEYQELFAMKDEIDVVVNASYSQMHYSITMDLLNHGFNVVVEKPFGATYEEAMNMVNTAQQKGVHLFVFQQSVLVETINFMKNV
ncbi:MAG: Gfo/Idh/MocA family oxidoreductase, partial [Clostridia bacterium]|nr:Gfo/Idh/MocA family oxidoreductase [Clostridia bacterium]